MRMEVGAYRVQTRGVARYDPRDPFYFAASLPWSSFLALLLAVWLGINGIFAGLYWLVPGCIAHVHTGSFADAFFFSVETLATVGYGVFAPDTLYGHVISTAEIFLGMAFTAIATGLMFLRFSRAKARFLYADNPIVTDVNGRPTLMLRIANGRSAVLTDGRATMNALILETTAEGHVFRRFHDLKLARSHLPLFPLSWTLMHELAPDSPLYRISPGWLEQNNIRLFVTVNARDHAIGVIVHDTHDYDGRQILFGVRYADAVVTDPEGNTFADLTRLSEVVAAQAAE